MRLLLAPIAVCCFLAVPPAAYAMDPIDIWLDVDAAAGLPKADVDDCLAMIQAFHRPQLVTRGVSAVYGNAPLKAGLPIAQEVVDRFGPKGMTVARGAVHARMLGEETDATRAMVAALEERPMHLLALGPLTNVATVLMLRPDLQNGIHSIIAVAGRRAGQKFQPNPEREAHFPDFNFELDPEAARIVLDSRVKLVLAPWEVASHVVLTRADIASLTEKSDAGSWIAEKSQLWLDMWRDELGMEGFTPFDTLAVAWLNHPNLIESAEVSVSIQEGPHDGVSPSGPVDDKETKPYLVVDFKAESGRYATYLIKPKNELKQHLLEALAGWK